MKRINITSGSSDPVAKILSNLAYTPFSYQGYSFKCAEAPLQGIKYEDAVEREAIFMMSGMDALKAGRKITKKIKEGEERFVYWLGEKIPYNSQPHRLLIAAFIREKIRQSVEIQQALLSTKGSFLYHDVGIESPNTSLPEKLYIEILLAERKVLIMLNSL
ncbi:MAG: hypothetical protein V4478_01210 [Patescibacteria group bacterium]